MGSPGIKAAVVDAGPLIHLSEIDALHLLHIFEHLHIPEAVWDETIGTNKLKAVDLAGIKSSVHKHSLDPERVQSFIQEKGLHRLQLGEIECLYLCLERGIPLILTDDLAAREAAKSLGIIPVGSLGIVVRAYKSGLLSLGEAEQKLSDLYEVSSLFVTRTIVELAIEQLHKRVK